MNCGRTGGAGCIGLDAMGVYKRVGGTFKSSFNKPFYLVSELQRRGEGEEVIVKEDERF